MSRFFAAASDSESESSSSDEELPQRPMGMPKPMQWSDEEEEVKRVVRSAKDKRFEELKEIIKKTRNHKKIKDMAKILSDFEEMCRAFEKARKVIDKEGACPRFYIRYLAELDDFVNECWEDKAGRKAMSKYNAKGLTALRTKLRKYNRDFESQITEYKEKPDLEDDMSAGSDSDSDSEDDDRPAENVAEMFKKTEPVVTKKPEPKGDDAGSDSDDMWYMSSSDSDDDDDNYNKYTGPMTADHFLKKTTAEADEKKKKKKEDKRAAPKVVRTEQVEDEEEGDWEEVKGGAAAPMEKPKMFSKDAEITHENVLKKLSEIISVRGKKGTDRSAQLSLLEELRSIAKAKSLGTAMDIKILFHIVASIFDYNPNIATCMKPEMWDKCVECVSELLAILAASGDEIICGPNISEDSETFTGAAPYCIRGCILTMVERMDDEFVKMLQACDAHSTEYIDRLKDETKVCEIINDLQKYLESQLLADEELSPITVEEICRVYLRRIGHLYYKFDYPAVQRDPKEPEDKENDSRYVMDRLCKYIYAKDSTDRIRTRAMLSHVYHHALHDRWFEARDLMLMSHLQDTIQYSDIPTQIMYNRAMVQLGLCAFRQGTIKDSHNCLVDIQSSGRAKELLAQGLLLQRQHERTPEQEKIEKRRQMPYHMHINLELLECVYLVSAMLIEIPYMAAHEFDARRRMISKNFHHVMRMSDKQPLVGPPESMREHVVAASKAMKIGDWNACHNFVINDKMNTKVWDLFYNGVAVKTLLTQKIKEESLRTYLFTYSAIYDSLSLITLADMFELTLPVVHAIINKMIINEELMASMDEPTHTVVMHRTEPTHLQALALQLSEKVSFLVDYNERTMETKSGIFFFQKQGQQGGYQGYQNRDQQGYRGNKDRDQQGGYQNRYKDRDQQGGYQNRYNKDRDQQGGYQNRYNKDRDQQGGYQNRYNKDRDQQGGYQGYGGRRPQRQNRY